jgi:hypothetical protein
MNDEFPSQCSIKTKLKGKKKFLLYKVDKNSGWESLKGNGFHVGSHVWKWNRYTQICMKWDSWGLCTSLP